MLSTWYFPSLISKPPPPETTTYFTTLAPGTSRPPWRAADDMRLSSHSKIGPLRAAAITWPGVCDAHCRVRVVMLIAVGSLHRS